MKIAVISDNRVHVSQHFGRASMYVVATVEKGKIVHKENRDKIGRQHFVGT